MINKLTYIEETAQAYFSQLEEEPTSVRSVFSRVIEQAIHACPITFVGVFSKINYIIKEKNIPDDVAAMIHRTRKELFPEHNRTLELTDIQRHIRSTALLVYYIFDKQTAIPESLCMLSAPSDKAATWGRFDENMLRVVVEDWDDDFIYATEEENGSVLKICYSAKNNILTREGKGDWSYLSRILTKGCQLNLVRIRMTDDVCYPELIIYEPDFLINITTISSCFETYAESPYVNLVNKIKPSPNTKPIHLGNFAGQLLDEVVHGDDKPFSDSLKDFVRKNILQLITCTELTNSKNFNQFCEDAKVQRENIKNLISDALPSYVSDYDSKKVLLEPSFISEVLGIQGRLDFLYENNGNTLIIEQKSGKGDYAPTLLPPDEPAAREQHIVQLLLYRALFIYEFRRYANSVQHVMLLYSKYKRGLLDVPPMPELFLRAIRMRNLLAWCEINYAEKGFDILRNLTPNMLNKKGITGNLWDNYIKLQLTELLSPISKASPIEQNYYLRFMQFIAKEQMLSKVGTKMKENSGFASIWHDTLADKLSAGNIYSNLTISKFDGSGNAVERIVLNLPKQNNDIDVSSNFRPGDIVILYPYNANSVPNACAQMVNRASIASITTTEITLKLRNSQTDKSVFDVPEDMVWAIEHDLFESTTGGLYSAMHSFLSAPQSRKDLILCQREPTIDCNQHRKGEYGDFNSLVERAVQAQDVFLIIGPPGTGKTSFGLVNLLNEALLDETSNILLLSYTNRAVDEICSKLLLLIKENPQLDFLRIGSELSCEADYKPFLLSKRAEELSSGNEVAKLIRKTRIFCGTTSAFNANISLLKIKHFDLAIVDESSQILEPHLIGLLSAAQDGVPAIKRFVLIGDHKQLPAVVQQSQEDSAVDDELLNAIHLTDCRNSLFERLLTNYRQEDGTYDERLVYMLRHQGRMHRDIAAFPNAEFYGGELDVVPLPHQTAEGNELRVMFVDCPLPVNSISDKVNTVEAERMAKDAYNIYLANSQTFDEGNTLGIIVPYRNQIVAVRRALAAYDVPALLKITVDTVERYQGSQRDYILYGFTVQRSYQLNFLSSNTFEDHGVLIDRKLNVAMTRARLQLIMYGNSTILRENPVFARLIDFTKK